MHSVFVYYSVAALVQTRNLKAFRVLGFFMEFPEKPSFSNDFTYFVGLCQAVFNYSHICRFISLCHSLCAVCTKTLVVLIVSAERFYPVIVLK